MCVCVGDGRVQHKGTDLASLVRWDVWALTGWDGGEAVGSGRGRFGSSRAGGSRAGSAEGGVLVDMLIGCGGTRHVRASVECGVWGGCYRPKVASI